MADYGIAIITADHAFAPGPDTLDRVERVLLDLRVIGTRLPVAPGSELVKWAPGAEAGRHIQGVPLEISLYVGEPTPFFDGYMVVCHPTFILETINGDPTPLREVLERALGVPLAIHPFRL